MSKSKASWHDAKEIAYERQGGLCGICNKPVRFRDCIGHHVIPKSKNGPNTPDNAQIRHSWCETWAHEHYRDGNPPRVEPGSHNSTGFFFRKKRKR